jgi:hypothetical protein
VLWKGLPATAERQILRQVSERFPHHLLLFSKLQKSYDWYKLIG